MFVILTKAFSEQSVTSRLETSRYRDFSQFFESIGLGLENFGLEKKVSVSVSKIFSLKKKVSKIFGLEKKSRYRSQKFWSQNGLSFGLKRFGLKKVSVSVSKILA